MLKIHNYVINYHNNLKKYLRKSSRVECKICKTMYHLKLIYIDKMYVSSYEFLKFTVFLERHGRSEFREIEKIGWVQ